ncbi:MAG: hypothetical protein ACRCZI_03705, partial [Cetobacterium sp.]
MYLFNEASKILKSCCKNKVTLTTATVVSFLINGAVAFGGVEDYLGQVFSGTTIWKENLNNSNDSSKSGLLNIWEDFNTNNPTIVTNEATLTQGKSDKILAAVNIANAADFTNGKNGKIYVDKGQDIGTAISKSFGSLDRDIEKTSSNLSNEGLIDIKNVAIGNGIIANGYKEEKNKLGKILYIGKDNVELSNSGTIKISELTEKTIGKLEKVAWNLLHDFKIDIEDVESKGSIGNGIIVGDNVNVTNSGTIDIANNTAMAIKGTINGEAKEVTFAGVGIGAAHSTKKAVDGVRKSVKNEGVIDLKGNNFVGIAGVGDIDIVNSGTIKTLGDNSAAVLLMEGATLENSGTILATGKNSNAIVSAGEIDDTLKLRKGSHIEGVVNLGAGNDTIDVNGVGTAEKAEKLDVMNVENITINHSNIDLYGELTDSEISLGNSDGDNKLTNYATLVSTEVGEASISIEGTDQTEENQNTVTVVNEGNITSKGFGIYLNGYYTKYNPSKIINNKDILINGFVNTTSGDAPFIYSNGIYSASRPGAVEPAGYVENNGKIEVKLNEEDQNSILSILATNPKKLYANIAGIRLHENTSGINTGEIVVNAHTGNGILLTAGEENSLDNPKPVKESTFENTISGKIVMTGDYAKGINASNRAIKKVMDLSAVNNGEISINGSNSIGMYADNSEITNTDSGEIKLNLFEEDGVTVANNKAMYGINGSTVTNTGSIYLSDVTVEKIGTAELKDLEAYVNNVLVSGDESTKVSNTGVVRNKDGKVIVAAGGDLSEIPGIEITPDGNYIVDNDVLASLDKDEVLKTDSTIIFTGDKLDLSINASEKFDSNKFLIEITENSKVDMSGVLNGQDKGVAINDSTVNITNSSIGVNSENKDAIALQITNNSKLNISETTVKGGIDLNDSELNIKNSGIVGNIKLDNNSKLSMDTVSTESFTGTIEGSNDGSGITLGDKTIEDKVAVTSFSGTIKNLDNVNTNGILVMDEKSNFENSSINVGAENLLVIRVGEGKDDYALSEKNGTLTLAENGHLMIETGRMNLKDGDEIKLSTFIDGDSANIHASDFIYDISILETEEDKNENLPKTIEELPVEGTTLVVSIKEAKDLGIDADITDVYDSLADTGKLGDLNSVGFGHSVAELNSILKQNSHKNGYALGDKVSRDSIGVWNDVVKNNIKFLEAGEFKISGLSTGAFESTDTNVEYDFAGAGLMVLGEYGYDSK